MDCGRPVRLPAAGVGVPQCRACGHVLWSNILKKLKVLAKHGKDAVESKCPNCEGKLLMPAAWKTTR